MGSFVSGAAQRLLAVLWVHYAERNKKLEAFFIGLMQGIAYLVGASIVLSFSIDAVVCAIAFVIGFGVGSIVGIDMKQRFLT